MGKKDEVQAPSKILTATEASQLLRVSRGTVFALAGAGKLPGRKVGREWRFNSAELLQWLSGSEPAVEVG